jgi:hypothetical protein
VTYRHPARRPLAVTAYARSMAEHLELPRPLQLARTMAWSLSESLGIPLAAFAIAAWLGGRDIGLLAGLAATWITVAVRKFATGSVPGLLGISALVLSIQTAVVLATGNLWIFLVHFPLANLCLCIMFARTARGPRPLCAQLAAEMLALRQPAGHQAGLHRFFQGATWLWSGVFLLLAACLAGLLATEPTATFLVLCTVATVTLIAGGIGASVLWFRSVLRRHGLQLRFAPA